jgi:hypothetical protein
MLTRSSVLFSMGVPVMAQLRSRRRPRTTRAVFDRALEADSVGPHRRELDVTHSPWTNSLSLLPF